MKRNKTFTTILFLGLFLLLVGCGFHLRGTEPLLAQPKIIYIETTSPYSSFTRRLKNHLYASRIQIASTPNQASKILRILDEQMTTRQTSIGSNQYTQEHIAMYTVKYSIQSQTGKTRVEPTTIHAERRIITLPNEEPENSHKFDETKTIMQEELITQLLLQLSTENRHLP